MSITVEVTDQHGGFIRSTRNKITGWIDVRIHNGKTGEDNSMLVDPHDPEVVAWLKEVYQPGHLDILLGRG